MRTRKLALISLIALLPLVGLTPTKVRAEEPQGLIYPLPPVVVEEEMTVLVADIGTAERLYQEWLVEQAKKKVVPKRQILPYNGNGFARGYCTDYVARKKTIPWRGDAYKWIANSKAFGATVDKIPEVGAILQTNEGSIGHIAYIESVDGDTFTISEWNYAGLYVKTIRTFNINDPRIKGIIHY